MLGNNSCLVLQATHVDRPLFAHGYPLSRFVTDPHDEDPPSSAPSWPGCCLPFPFINPTFPIDSVTIPRFVTDPHDEDPSFRRIGDMLKAAKAERGLAR